VITPPRVVACIEPDKYRAQHLAHATDQASTSAFERDCSNLANASRMSATAPVVTHCSRLHEARCKAIERGFDLPGDLHECVDANRRCTQSRQCAKSRLAIQFRTITLESRMEPGPVAMARCCARIYPGVIAATNRGGRDHKIARVSYKEFELPPGSALCLNADQSGAFVAQLWRSKHGNGSSLHPHAVRIASAVLFSHCPSPALRKGGEETPEIMAVVGARSRGQASRRTSG